MARREKAIQTKTVTEIRRAFPGALVRVKHGTAFAILGDADVYGCLPQFDGKMFWLEVKNEQGVLTKIQVIRLKEAQEAGAIAHAIHDAKEAVALLHIYQEGLKYGRRTGLR